MKKKTLLIVIIFVIILLLVAGGIFAYLFLATDMFKTNKELFAKYVGKMSDTKSGFASTSLIEYQNKKLNTSYENKGSFSVYTDMLGETTDQSMQSIINAIDLANDTNITFNGKVDNSNKKVEENIQINYTDTVNLPFTYKQDGDIYGIKVDSITQNYVAVENNNLKELFQKLGVTDVSQIPDKLEVQEIESIKFTDEEKTHLLNTYLQPIFNNISEDKFNRIENTDGSVSYNVTLTNQELKNIVIQILQTLSTDIMMINKINNIIGEAYQSETMTISAENIQELIDNLNDTTVEDGNIILTVVQKDGVTNKLTINIENVTIDITKEQTNSNVIYNFSITGDTVDVYVEMSFLGLDSDAVTENLTVRVNMGTQMIIDYAFENTVTFGNTINIEDFSETTTAVLNNYPAEQLQPFITQLGMAISQINSNQMTQIGYPVEFANPMVMWFTAPSIIGMYNNVSSSINNSDLNKEELETKNAKFEAYKGEIRGSQAKVLCDQIRTNNLSETSEKINVKLGDTASSTEFISNVNDVETVKNNIQPAKTYNVTLSYDVTTGYVCEIGIVETN